MKLEMNISDEQVAQIINQANEDIAVHRERIGELQAWVQPYRKERQKRRMKAAAKAKAELIPKTQCKKNQGNWRCPRKTSAESGFCKIHDPSTPICSASGCHRIVPKALADSTFCKRHSPDVCAEGYCYETRCRDSKFCLQHVGFVAYGALTNKEGKLEYLELPNVEEFDIDEAMKIDLEEMEEGYAHVNGDNWQEAAKGFSRLEPKFPQ